MLRRKIPFFDLTLKCPLAVSEATMLAVDYQMRRDDGDVQGTIGM